MEDLDHATLPKQQNRLSVLSGDQGGLTFALQALLSRHESYINEAQTERARLSTCISDLESERLSLQNANERIVAENRELLQRLEQLNGNLVDSDQDVKRLESLLLDCELEVKRLNGLVRRTEELDSRLQDMERERHSLNQQVEEGKEESRSMLARWRESERKVRELEEDVRRIEWEARVDREKHEEIIARLEKERSLERELGGAEGRLKGAAAIQSLGKNAAGSKNVVSHFVKDILQDNANLQAGIAELRQLLQSSNEEVQNLREQIMMHQPVAESEDDNQARRSVSLDQELQLEPESPKQLQQEVHVHHHYHAKLAKSRVTPARRPSRKRPILPGLAHLPDSTTPSSPISKPYRFNSSPVVPTVYQSQSQKNRWSMQSSATMSSVLSSIPSSPRSYFDRGGSIFDRLELGEESSRPTSPESVGDLLSPGPGQWKFKDRPYLDACEEEDDRREAFHMSPLVESKPAFDVDDLPTPSDFEPSQDEKELTPKPSVDLRTPEIHVEDSIETPPELRPPDNDQTPVMTRPSTREESDAIIDRIPVIRPSLNRKGSHETLVSVAGMDIHIAQRASPAATLELLHNHFAHSPSQTRKVSATQPLASVTEYTAVSTNAFTAQPDSRKILSRMPSSIEALSGIAVPRPRVARAPPSAIGRLGGWVRGRWGVAPTKSVGNLRAVSLNQEAASITSSSTSQEDQPETENSNSISSSTPGTSTGETGSISSQDNVAPNSVQAKIDPLAIMFAGRPPGVNQQGPIPGFRAAMMSKRTPSQVMATVIDEEGLKQGLAE